MGWMPVSGIAQGFGIGIDIRKEKRGFMPFQVFI